MITYTRWLMSNGNDRVLLIPQSSSSGDLGNEEYSAVAITPKSIPTWSGSTC